ncbi:MAG TPA: hypothetical protein DIS79_06850 [Bacteroidetes bacterium]|nr:hypothetical protein [Bacteroidota bacterium]HRK03877.1 glycosyltransferase [Chlorobiota bacterium]
MKMPDISVLIVNYNVKDYLLQCLRSLYRSEGDVSIEIVVVDNASSDRSVADLQQVFPDVIWVALDENVGFGRGNNVGLQYCTGRYVLFLNPDTIVSPDTAFTMVRYMDQHPDVGIAGCKVLNPDGTFQLACRRGLPTPWASFCKLFGLQALFPKIKLFSGYNLTYRSVDEMYPVDALIGAFMIAPTSMVREIGGFDPAFFMYGEDVDLCYRIQKTGKTVMYVPTTTIVHFKGESTRRSSMDDVKVFYDAMEIFARKHFGKNAIWLVFLRLGIRIRWFIALLLRYRLPIAIAIVDAVCVVTALLLATTIRFESPFGFVDYAYPTVLIVVPLVVLLSLIGVGEYVEHKPTVRRSAVGMLVAFFILSALTYFFKEYAFSRGVVLMTIGLSTALMSVVRIVSRALERRSSGRRRRSVVVGAPEEIEVLLRELSEHEPTTNIIGLVSPGRIDGADAGGIRYIGTLDYLHKIVRENDIDEVICATNGLTDEEISSLHRSVTLNDASFHLAHEYAALLAARVIHDVSGIEPTIRTSPLLMFRNRTVKRLMDILVSVLVLLWYAPGLILGVRRIRSSAASWFAVLRGHKSCVGLVPDGKRRQAGKEGIIGLAHFGITTNVSEGTIENLNDYYVEHFTLALDVEILLKHLFRRSRGK